VTFAYNDDNELTSYNGTATFVYDGDGLRVAKTVGKTTEHFVWDHAEGTPLLLEDGTNYYIYGPSGLPSEQISKSGTVTYLFHDQIGNTRLVVNTKGEDVGSYNYDPYGAATHSGSTTTPLEYAGQYAESESGLVYMRGRYYDPTTGQFISSDPLANVTQAPYYYGADNPENDVDPSGLCNIDPFSSSNCVYEAAKTTANFVSEHPVLDGVILGGVAVATGGAALVVDGAVSGFVLGGVSLSTGAAATALDTGSCVSGDTTACVGASLGAASVGLGVPELLEATGFIDEAGSYRWLSAVGVGLGAAGDAWDAFTGLPEVQKVECIPGDGVTAVRGPGAGSGSED
jgi:RHS repeat-associated protein